MTNPTLTPEALDLLRSRETFAHATGFCTGSDIDGPDDAGHEDWHGFAWHSEGAPDGMEIDDEGTTTVMGHGLSGPPAVDCHDLVLTMSLDRDIPCPWCGDGTGEEDRRPECVLCEGDGYLPTGTGDWCATYRRWDVRRWCVELGKYLTVREDGRTFRTDDAPEWVEDLVNEGGTALDHHISSPDHVYDALLVLGADHGDDPDPNDLTSELADGCVEIYTAPLYAWAGTPLGQCWVAESVDSIGSTDPNGQFTMAQYLMYSAILGAALGTIVEWSEDGYEA